MSFTDFCHNEITKVEQTTEFIVFDIGRTRPRTLKVRKEKLPNLLVSLVQTPSDAHEITRINKEIIEAVIRKYAL
jgi:hypothetical protein